MTNKGYYTVQGWMINELKLKGNELHIYAIINGYSKDGQGEYFGSVQYLAETIGASKPTVIKALQSLTAKGFLLKKSFTKNNITQCRYRVSGFTSKETLPETSKETLPETSKETLLETGKETLPNNKYKNNIININKDKKNSYGEHNNVKLSKEEYQKCIDKYSLSVLLCAIDKLSNYKLSSGKKYKSDYGALNTWVFKSILSESEYNEIKKNTGQRRVEEYSGQFEFERNMEQLVRRAYNE